MWQLNNSNHEIRNPNIGEQKYAENIGGMWQC